MNTWGEKKDMELVELGKVVKIHGYLGQMKIATKYDKGFDIKRIKKLFDNEEKEFSVLKIFQTKEGVVVALDGIDLQKAKTYIGKMFYADREIMDGKILIEDLKGSLVYFEDETLLGKITAVEDYGAAEVFFVKCQNQKELMFPNVKDIILSFDYKEKKVIINKRRLKEVSDYED